MRCPHCGKETDSPTGMDKAERAAELTLLQYCATVPEAVKKPLSPGKKEKALAAIEQSCAEFEREYGLNVRMPALEAWKAAGG